jgi:hypothetical protein
LIDLLEFLVNVLLELGFDRGHTHIEHDEVTIKHVVTVVKELVHLVSEVILAFFEIVENWLDALQVVLGKDSELLNCSKQFNQLCDSSTEEIKATEDRIWGKFKLFAFGHVHQALFGELILLCISLVEVDAGLKDWNELIWWIGIMVPKNIISR